MSAGTLDGLERTLSCSCTQPPDEARRPDGARRLDEDCCRSRAARGETRDDLRFLLRAADADFVFFLEVRGRGVVPAGGAHRRVARSCARPCSIGVRTTVLTSATLTVAGSFDYVRGRLGVGTARELRLPSEFDYATPGDALPAAAHAVIRSRRSSPTRRRARVVDDPAAHRRARVRAVHELRDAARRAARVVERRSAVPDAGAGHGAAIGAARALPRDAERGAARDVQLLAGRGRHRRCAELRDHRQAAVRLAGRSDHGGPTRAISARGGDPFGDYQVPLAILTLLQGLGRLLRHRLDRGVLAVLDPRLRTMGTAGGSWRRCRPRR